MTTNFIEETLGVVQNKTKENLLNIYISAGQVILRSYKVHLMMAYVHVSSSADTRVILIIIILRGKIEVIG
jgi:hypothetical protein